MIMVYILQEVPKEIGGTSPARHMLLRVERAIGYITGNALRIIGLHYAQAEVILDRKEISRKRATLLYIMTKIGYNPN